MVTILLYHIPFLLIKKKKLRLINSIYINRQAELDGSLQSIVQYLYKEFSCKFVIITRQHTICMRNS